MNNVQQKATNVNPDVLVCVRAANALLRENRIVDAKKQVEKALDLDRSNAHLLAMYKRLLSLAHDHYGDVGYFRTTHPSTDIYSYANWGSRRWEYCYVEKLLNEIGVEDKQVVDIGIGFPSEHNFYFSYAKSKCFLTAFDPDGRLDEVTRLSPRGNIFRRSAENINMKSGSVDVVVSISSFEHFSFDAFQKTIKEVHRILKDDGHLIITLDLTYDKKSSARWAVLEKTINGFPPEENDCQLQENHQQLTLEYFLKLLSPYFYPEDANIYNKERSITERVYSPEWNSHIAYLNLQKGPGSDVSPQKQLQYDLQVPARKELRERIKKFNKIVVWGLKTSGHTHAHIHRHFYETLKKLELNAYWVDDYQENKCVIEKGDMVIAVGVADDNLPIKEGVSYCLHNCNDEIHNKIDPSKNIRLQVYTNHDRNQKADQKWNEVTHFDTRKRTLFQPWASDLLEEEFMEPVFEPASKTVYWVGSIWNNERNQGNLEEMRTLQEVLERRGIKFVQLEGIQDTLNIEYVRKSFIAPTIAGRWQVKHNYLPCRMWKNIAYGQLGVSNVKKFNDIFTGCSVPGSNIEELVQNTLELSLAEYREMICQQQEIVKKHHTYVNRLLNIVRAFEYADSC